MKNLFKILILSLFWGCKKESDTITPKYQLNAVVSLKSSPNTFYYDVFVSNDRNAPPNLWLWVKRIEVTDLINGHFTFSFNAPTVCYLSINRGLPVYGASRETLMGNVLEPLDFNSVTIYK